MKVPLFWLYIHTNLGKCLPNFFTKVGTESELLDPKVAL